MWARAARAVGAALLFVLVPATASYAELQPARTALDACTGGSLWQSNTYRYSEHPGHIITCNLGTVTAGTVLQVEHGQSDWQVSFDGGTTWVTDGAPVSPWRSGPMVAGPVSVQFRNSDNGGWMVVHSLALDVPPPPPPPSPSPTPTPEPTPTPTTPADPDPSPEPSTTAPPASSVDLAPLVASVEEQGELTREVLAWGLGLTCFAAGCLVAGAFRA